MPQNKNSQSGNVFVFILLGIVLFGALIFALTKSSQQSTSGLTKKQVELSAQQIINYGRIMEQTVSKLRARGCSENELNFENSVIAGYTNANAPADGSCDVFGPNGGNLDVYNPPAGLQDGVYFTYRPMRVTAGYDDDPSRTVPDLTLLIGIGDQAICEEIVDILHPDSSLLVSGGTHTYGPIFTGTYGSAYAFGQWPDDTASCFAQPNRAPNLYYHVLIQRD